MAGPGGSIGGPPTSACRGGHWGLGRGPGGAFWGHGRASGDTCEGRGSADGRSRPRQCGGHGGGAAQTREPGRGRCREASDRGVHQVGGGWMGRGDRGLHLQAGRESGVVGCRACCWEGLDPRRGRGTVASTRGRGPELLTTWGMKALWSRCCPGAVSSLGDLCLSGSRRVLCCLSGPAVFLAVRAPDPACSLLALPGLPSGCVFSCHSSPGFAASPLDASTSGRRSPVSSQSVFLQKAVTFGLGFITLPSPLVSSLLRRTDPPPRPAVSSRGLAQAPSAPGRPAQRGSAPGRRTHLTSPPVSGTPTRSCFLLNRVLARSPRPCAARRPVSLGVCCGLSPEL